MSPRFNLISNTRTSFVEYCGDAVRLTPSTPAIVDEVILSLKDKPEKIRKVTTFRTSKGELIERNFDYFDKPFRQRVYSNEPDNVIGKNEYVLSKNVKEYELDREIMGVYKDIVQLPNTNRKFFWMPKKSVTHHVSINDETNEKILSQVIIENTKTLGRKKHTFTEYSPIKNGKYQNGDKKILSFRVNTSTNQVVNHSMHAQGVKKPREDSFLAYRALTINDSKAPFAKRFMKERAVDTTGVKIEPEYNPISEKDTGFKAKFLPDEGKIRFNKDYKFKSKSEVASVSAHESEHVYQHYLQARYKECENNWQADVREQFGPLTESESIVEAEKYDNAIESYVPYYVDREAYRSNLIEVLANQKGFCMKNLYDFEGSFLRMSFRHIPPELL